MAGYELPVGILLLALFTFCPRAAGQSGALERADVLFNDGAYLSRKGRYTEARKQWEQSLAIYRELGMGRKAASALANLGIANHRLGDGERGRAMVDEALAIFRALSLEEEAVGVLNNLGAIYMESGQAEKARASFEEVLAAYRQLRLEPQIAATIKNLGVAARLNGEIHQARAYFNEALKIFRKLGLRNEAAGVLNGIGVIEMDAREWERARAYFEEALESYDPLRLQKGPFDTLSNLATVSEASDDHAAARAHLERALEGYDQLGAEKETADTMSKLGAIAGQLGDYTSACAYFDVALTAYRKLGLRVEMADTSLNLGRALTFLGEYAKAKVHLDEAYASYSSLRLEQQAADTLLSLGNVAQVVGDYVQARVHFELALRRFRELNLRGDATGALLNLGNLARDLGHYSQARANFEAALRSYRELGQKYGSAGALLNLGVTAWDMGEWEQALTSYGQALAAFRALGRPVEEAIIRCNTADVYIEQRRYAEALRIYSVEKRCGGAREGRAYLLQGSLDAAAGKFRAALNQAGQDGDAEELAASRIGLGLSEESQGNFESAQHQFSDAVAGMEEQRTSLSSGERQHFLSGKVGGFRRLEAYEGLVRVLFRLRRLELAFYWSEHTKARGLLEAVARSAPNIALGIPAALRLNEQDLVHRIGAKQKQLVSAIEREDKESQGRLRSELLELKQQLQTFIARLRRDHPEYAAVQYPQPLHASEQALRAGEVLLAYEVTETATLVFVVRGGKVDRAVELKVTRREWAEAVQRYRAVFVQVGQTQSTTSLSTLDVNLGHKLWQQLLEEPLAGLQPGEKVLIVPDEMLCLLPFEALVEQLPPQEQAWGNGAHGPFPQGVKYVGDSRVLSYWQSASSMTVLRRLGKTASGQRLFAVADPVFGLDDPRLQTGLDGGKPRMEGPGSLTSRRPTVEESAARSEEDLHFKRLPKTADMVVRLREIYGDAMNALMGPAANKSAVRREPLEQYGAAVLFATHGIVSERVPYLQQAALVLSSPAVTGEIGADGDRFLTMADVMDLKLRTELAGALACETGLGKDVGGEGVMSLGRAFQYAGARSALISLWSVEDDSTNILAVRVLDGMKRGEAKDEAMLAARRQLRAQGYEHPFYWAAFILVGERDLTKE